MNPYIIIRPFLFALPEEITHSLAIWGLRCDLLPKSYTYSSDILSSRVFGIDFSNPVGLAAGFDKNGEVIDSLISHGFGFVETGTVTPRKQSGNPSPRLFRLVEDRAIINRMGFNNYGVEQYIINLKKHKSNGVIGANIGKNKDSKDASVDYITMIEKVYGLSDYITVNISSPNTPDLRELQKHEALDNLLSEIMSTKNRMIEITGKNIPILLKIAPDLDDSELQDIAEEVIKHKVNGLIVGNTTIQRDHLKNKKLAFEAGGLSGRPLFSKSNEILAKMYLMTEGKIPIIGAGGVSTGDDAYKKIRLGASLVQIYTSLIYEGFCVINKINKRLEELLERDGFKSISEAVGTG